LPQTPLTRLGHPRTPAQPEVTVLAGAVSSESNLPRVMGAPSFGSRFDPDERKPSPKQNVSIMTGTLVGASGSPLPTTGQPSTQPPPVQAPQRAVAVPVDEFDPVIFNAQAHPQQK